jgi:hypothetical protein
MFSYNFLKCNFTDSSKSLLGQAVRRRKGGDRPCTLRYLSSDLILTEIDVAYIFNQPHVFAAFIAPIFFFQLRLSLHLN